MDDRVRQQATKLVEWCVEVEPGDTVTIIANEAAKELVTALHAELGDRGAEPVTVYATMDVSVGLSGEPMRAFLQHHDDEFTSPSHLLALLEESDAVIGIRSDTNTNVLSDVSEETKQRRAEAMAPFMDVLTEKEQVCGTQHPTQAWAQRAGMSLPEYEDFVYGAMLRDWAAVEEKQESLRERLESASEARITGPETDITMSLDGMHAVSDIGERNFPGGEVFTAPVVDSVEGEIWFDKPSMVQGHEVEDVRLTVKDGTIVEYSAGKNEETLESVLSTDEGASRIGELGVGMNEGIDRFTRNMLFDEKMDGTVHLAIGRAYHWTVGEDREQNQSAVHVDLLKDMSEGRIELDGEVVQEDGEFVWE
ncbi:aminopeptidase [Halalkalirubrum salinum]|uniref:aminopeptidase n=1 Tax=Halalkalirubrum salinum TaxID=2563889 RepID=UPI0010FAE79E